jgi:hypothetical protein
MVANSADAILRLRRCVFNHLSRIEWSLCRIPAVPRSEYGRAIGSDLFGDEKSRRQLGARHHMTTPPGRTCHLTTYRPVAADAPEGTRDATGPFTWTHGA